MAQTDSEIKNIIFDLGGVIIDLKREKAVSALKEIGLAEADTLLGLYQQEGVFYNLETGLMTSAQCYDEIRRIIISSGATAPSDENIERAFCDFLDGIPLKRLERIRTLRDKGYRVFALSNTNPIMYDGWIKEAFSQEGLKINDYFEGIITSFAEKVCKPNPLIFEIALRRYGLMPEETLMLDDSTVNCESAKSVGMQARCVGLTEKDDMLAITEKFL